MNWSAVVVGSVVVVAVGLIGVRSLEIDAETSSEEALEDTEAAIWEVSSKMMVTVFVSSWTVETTVTVSGEPQTVYRLGQVPSAICNETYSLLYRREGIETALDFIL